MRRPLVVVIVLASLAAAYGDRTLVARCSRTPGPPVGLKHPRAIYMVGTPLPDTVLAGAGGVAYTIGDGHRGPGRDLAIHGQVFAVERLGPLELAALPPAVSRVVLVPWDYGADCSPTPWSGSYRWMPPDDRGFVMAALRDPQYWVDGVPTLDVHSPGSLPYPRHDERPPWPVFGATDSILTPDELFTLLEAAPTLADVQEAPEAALVPFRAWIRANPRIASRWPAEKVIGEARRHANLAIRRRIVSPVGGTYRFTMERPGQDSAVFFLRTYPRISGIWNYPGGASDSVLPLLTLADYYLLAAVALSESDLPARGADRMIDREGYVGVVHEPTVRTDGTRAWRGRVELPFIERLLLSEMAIADRTSGNETNGTFELGGGGRMRAEMVIGTSNGRRIVFRGERISGVLVDAAW